MARFTLDPAMDGERRADRVATVESRPVRLSGTTDAPLLRGWLHFAALLASIPASAALIRRAGAGRGIAVYCAALVVLFGVSAAYHLLPWSDAARPWVRRIDHSTIYLFIAASYTPFCLRATPGGLGHTLLAAVWLGAAGGVALKLISIERTRLAAGPLYLVLGWLGLLTLPSDVRLLDVRQVVLLVAMGLLYTVGAAVLASRRPDPFPDVFGYHEIWHGLVVAAGACYFVVLWSLTGTR